MGSHLERLEGRAVSRGVRNRTLSCTYQLPPQRQAARAGQDVNFTGCQLGISCCQLSGNAVSFARGHGESRHSRIRYRAERG
jgi:hypothetical protein